MSLDRGKLGLPVLAALAFLAAAPGCKKGTDDKPKTPSVLQLGQDELAARLKEVARIDFLDGKDDFDEATLSQRNQAFLRALGEKDPVARENFIIRLRAIMKARKTPQDEADAQDDFNLFDLDDLYKWLQKRDAMVKADGTVQFPTKEAEQRTGLGDLTMDDEIWFVATPETLKKMNITADGPLKVFRVDKETEAFMGGKRIKVKPGTFVVKVRLTPPEGAPKEAEPAFVFYRVVVFNGDRIIDSLSQDFTEPVDKKAAKAPEAFEQFLRIKMPEFSLTKGRQLFQQNRKTYEKICHAEYPELLVRDGMPFDKHFVYFIQWTEANRLPINEDSMRAFFEALLNRRQKPPKDAPKDEGDQIVNQADDSLQGRPDQDENILSYEDGRRQKAEQAAEVSLKNHGPLFAIIRQAGSFFDPYTYNRLMNDYTTRVATTVVAQNEYLVIRDIKDDLQDSDLPNDIRKAAKPGTFAQRLNKTTTYNKSTDSALRDALAFSANTIEAGDVRAANFQVQYNPDGTIVAVSLNGQPYSPQTFIAPPSALQNPANNRVTFEFGGLKRTIDLQDYFDRYRALSAQNRGRSQQLIFFNRKTDKTSKMRNPAWFVERGDDFYKGIAEEITRGAGSSTQKVLAIGNWLQYNLDYIPEITERNKLTLGTFMDRGGDCEDSFVAYKTLANSIGLGDFVGGVLFKDHVAAIVKGAHGRTTYEINGEVWTIVETATGEGQNVKPGETNRRNPLAFIMPNGEVVKAAGSDEIPLKIVPENGLDDTLMAKFDAARQTLLDFVKDPKNQPKEENFREDSSIGDEGDPLAKAMVKAYSGIAQTGVMAESVSQRYTEALESWIKLLEAWAEFAQKADEAARAQEVKSEPKLAGEAGQRYLEARRHFFQNVKPTFEKLQEILKSCVGKETSEAAMIDCNDRMVGVINDSGVSIDFEKMKEEFHETLTHDPKYKAAIEKDLEKVAKVLNKFIYAPLNAILQVLGQHEVRH